MQSMTGANRLVGRPSHVSLRGTATRPSWTSERRKETCPFSSPWPIRTCTGSGLDVPAVRPIFEEYVASFGLADRLRFHAADFFADPLPAGGRTMMGLILEDWDLEQKRALIAKAYSALPTDGALIIYEPMIDEERQANAFALLQSLNMLIELPGGSIATGSEIRGWLREAGFRTTTLYELSGSVYSMVVGVK